MMKWMKNCHEMTQLISEELERPLKLGEKMEMRMHTTMCKACKQFKTNSEFLRETMQAFKNYKE